MYISKAKLISLIMRNYRQWGDEYDVMQILGDIEDMPEEDVSPVKKGRWVADNNGFVNGFPEEHMWLCSVCGLGKWGKLTWKYCPRCGAKMEANNGND